MKNKNRPAVARAALEDREPRVELDKQPELLPTMEWSEERKELQLALLRCQAKLDYADPSSLNTHHKNKYASNASVTKASRPHLLEEGLLVTVSSRVIDYPTLNIERKNGKGDWVNIVVVCARVKTSALVTHVESGQWVENFIVADTLHTDSQAIKSASTYGWRICVCPLVGIVQDDDDGNAARGLNNGQTPPASHPQQAMPQRSSAAAAADGPRVQQPSPPEELKHELKADEHVWRGNLMAVEVIEGSNTRGPWSKWNVKGYADNEEISFVTFSTTTGPDAESYYNNSVPVKILYKVGEYRGQPQNELLGIKEDDS